MTIKAGRLTRRNMWWFMSLVMVTCAGLALSACEEESDPEPHPKAKSGEATNAVMAQRLDMAFLSLGEEGMLLYNLQTMGNLTMAPPEGTESIDDIAVSDPDYLMFVLDADPPAYVTVFSIVDPINPELRYGPIPVEIERYAGIDASGGKLVIAGGHQPLTVREYIKLPDSEEQFGELGDTISTMEYGVGLFDVTIDRLGEYAYVTTQFDDEETFGIVSISFAAFPLAPVIAREIILEGAGFTDGGLRPANFPVETAFYSIRDMDGTPLRDTLLIAYAGGLAFADITDPNTQLDIFRTMTIEELGVVPVNVDAHNGRAVVVGSLPEPRLVLIDISDIDNPTILESTTLSGYPTGAAISSSHWTAAQGSATEMVVPLPTP